MGVAMDSGEWPAGWMFYTGNNTGLELDLLWVVGIACAVVLLWQR